MHICYVWIKRLRVFTVNIRGVWMQADKFMNCDIAQRSLDVIDFIVYVRGVWIHTRYSSLQLI